MTKFPLTSVPSEFLSRGLRDECQGHGAIVNEAVQDMTETIAFSLWANPSTYYVQCIDLPPPFSIMSSIYGQLTATANEIFTILYGPAIERAHESPMHITYCHVERSTYPIQVSSLASAPSCRLSTQSLLHHAATLLLL